MKKPHAVFLIPHAAYRDFPRDTVRAMPVRSGECYGVTSMATQIKTMPTLSILRRKQVEARTGLSRSTIYARLNPKSPSYDPTFPKPIDLGHGMRNPPVGWIASEVEDWLATQIEKSRTA